MDILSMPIVTAVKSKSAGNPPKFDSILIPSTPAAFIMIKAVAPISTPQIILRNIGAEADSALIFLVLMALMASVFESAAVTYDNNTIKIKNNDKKPLKGYEFIMV